MSEIVYWSVIVFTVVCFMVEYTKGDDDDFR
jgi:hypothetical protein